jgi:hypothetical protein
MTDERSGRRVHERFACELPVTLTADGRVVDGKTQNLSLGGMFVTLGPERFAYGTKVIVKFRLPALKEPSEFAVTVRWDTAEGVGLQFGSLRAVEVWALNELFKKAK